MTLIVRENEKEGVSSQRRSRFEKATRSLATFVRSLRSFARTTHSAHSLCSAPLRYAPSTVSLTPLTPFTGSLTHFAHSLVGQLKFLNMFSRCYRVSREQTHFWRSLETRPRPISDMAHFIFSNPQHIKRARIWPKTTKRDRA